MNKINLIFAIILLIIQKNNINALDFSVVPIYEVKKFWDRRPCNIRHSKHQLGTKKYFDEVEKRKYFIEPHIPMFAEFKKWNGKKVLEIGCGLGTEAINFVRNGAELTIIELSEESLNLAKKRFEVFGLKVNFILGDAEEIDKLLPQEYKFDLIWSFGVIHHSPHPEIILKKCKNYLKDDGEIRMMVYSKISYKLFNLMRETSVCDFSKIDELISSYSEAQTGCPVTYSYTLEGARRLFADFEIIDIEKKHIFPWNIQKYILYQYEKEECFKNISEDDFKEFESELGWHMLIKARKFN